MVKVGIDTVAVYTPRYALDLATLAAARGIASDKYKIGLGQHQMSVAPPGEDVVTMAANAAKQALVDINVDDIEMLLFATESGIDQSKAAGLYLHELLKLPKRCRVVELKQACYSATAGMQLAMPYLRENQTKKVLLVASDIARYGLNTVGESSQGAGAVALVLSANPRVLAFDAEYGIATENIMDFWRPNYSHEAFVEGKYSSKMYLSMLEKSFLDYQQQSGRAFEDHQYFCYHTPVPRLVEKAHASLLKLNEQWIDEETANHQVEDALNYARQLGNSYTAALFISLASLLDATKDNMAGKRIGFYSYGSGCVAEYFSGVVQAGYQKALHTNYHTSMLSSRALLNYDEYAEFFNFAYTEDGSLQDIPVYETGSFRLEKMDQHKRLYQAVEMATNRPVFAGTEKNILRVYAPGKLILSGEHAVVYGAPALAMAINRYATATVTHDTQSQILFDLSDLSHRSRLSFNALLDMKERVKRKYHRFIRGEYTIRDVLQKPFELAQVALGIIAESLNVALPNGVNIQVQSDIPMGCGMGSSAATIVSVMHAVAKYLNVPIADEMLYKLALEAEQLQHGQSSGLDLKVALNGGCFYMHDQTIEARDVPNIPMYLVNSGTPISSTGQCVERVASHFKVHTLADEFAAVTNAMDVALKAHSLSGMQHAVRENHRLLTQIGVVPQTVQKFVSDVEAMGGAAKICGAGSVIGEQAGALWVLAEDKARIETLSATYGYNIIPLEGSIRGVHAA